MNQSVIDIPALRKLSNMIGGEVEDLKELVEDFITLIPQQIESMRSAYAAGDRAALRIAVHSTKSNARDLGALELAELCAQLEQQCKEDDSVDCGAELTTISVKADEAIQAFKTINLDDV